MTAFSYRFRVVAPSQAKVFQGRPNTLGRVTWTLIGVIDLTTGATDIRRNSDAHPDHAAACVRFRADFEALSDADRAQMVAIGQFADRAALEGLDRDAFEDVLLALQDVREHTRK